jgi:Protein of unknown function (DUF4199)
MNVSPAIKGLITGLIMIVLALIIYFSGQQPGSSLQYFIYAVYAIGIVWTITAWAKSASYTGKFGDAFQTGFKCFIIVALIMVLFTAVFSMLHPEFKEESAKYVREEMVKQNDKSPVEIDDAINNYKNRYTLILVFGAIFGYLIIGAVVSAITSLIITRRKN